MMKRAKEISNLKHLATVAAILLQVESCLVELWLNVRLNIFSVMSGQNQHFLGSPPV